MFNVAQGFNRWMLGVLLCGLALMALAPSRIVQAAPPQTAPMGHPAFASTDPFQGEETILIGQYLGQKDNWLIIYSFGKQAEVLVTQTTLFKGQPQVGDTLQIYATHQPDGALVAQTVIVWSDNGSKTAPPIITQ